MADKTLVRPLPVRLVLERGFRYAWESRAVLRGPYLIFATITILLDIAVGAMGQADPNALTYGVKCGGEILALCFAVGILRYVLLGEAPPPARFFHVNRNFLRYTISALIFVLAAMVYVETLSRLFEGEEAGPSGANALAALLVLALLPVVAVILMRLSLYLPVCALGETVPLAKIWQATAGNGLRLLVVGLLALIPFMAVDMGLLVLDRAISAPEKFDVYDAIITLLIGMVSAAQLVVFTIIQALEYDLLIRGGGPQANRKQPTAA